MFRALPLNRSIPWYDLKRRSLETHAIIAQESSYNVSPYYSSKEDWLSLARSTEGCPGCTVSIASPHVASTILVKLYCWFEPQIRTPKTLVWPSVMSSHSVLLKSNSEPTCHIKWNPVQVSVCVMYICMCVCVCICVCMRGGLCVCVCICGCVKKNVRFFKKYVFSRLIPSCILSYVTLDTRDNLYASVRWHILETIGIFIISMLGYSRDSGRQHWCGKSEEVITAADYPVANQPTNQRREKGGPSERRRYVPKKISSLGTCPLVAWISRLTHQQHPTGARGFRHNFIKYAMLFFTSVLRNLGKHERLF